MAGWGGGEREVMSLFARYEYNFHKLFHGAPRPDNVDGAHLLLLLLPPNPDDLSGTDCGTLESTLQQPASGAEA